MKIVLLPSFDLMFLLSVVLIYALSSFNYASNLDPSVLSAQITAPTQTPIPTKAPSPTPKKAVPKPTTPAPTLPVSGSVLDYMMSQINAYRNSKGLLSVTNDYFTCSFAKIRIQELSKSFSHSGFTNRIKNRTLPYPSYSLITENMANNSNFKNVVPSWLASAIHRGNIEKATPFACIEKQGNFFVYESYKP